MTVAQWAAAHPLILGDPGVSEDADSLRNELRRIRDDSITSITVGGLYRVALEDLAQIVSECTEANWDGYDAEPVELLAIPYVVTIVESLPVGFPTPEIAAEPDGEISLDWHLGPRRAFSVSVARNGRLSYAGLFGRSEVHGTEYMADGIPEPILEGIRRAVSSSR